jgi:hypothetical protein
MRGLSVPWVSQLPSKREGPLAECATPVVTKCQRLVAFDQIASLCVAADPSHRGGMSPRERVESGSYERSADARQVIATTRELGARASRSSELAPS